MSVESILKQKGTDVTTITPGATIKRAADWLRVKNIGCLVVTDGEQVLGLISEREIVHAFSHYGEAADERAAIETAPKEFRIRGGALSAGTFDRPDSRQVDGYQKRGRALPGLHQFDSAASENRSSSVADSMQRREFLSPGL